MRYRIQIVSYAIILLVLYLLENRPPGFKVRGGGKHSSPYRSQTVETSTDAVQFRFSPLLSSESVTRNSSRLSQAAVGDDTIQDPRYSKHIYIGEGYLAQSRHQQQQQQQVAPNLTLHRLPLPIRLVVLVRNEPEHDKTNKQTKKIHSSDVLSLSLSPRPING
jgi:hypothetical protein